MNEMEQATIDNLDDGMKTEFTILITALKKNYKGLIMLERMAKRTITTASHLLHQRKKAKKSKNILS
jgi:hypothetical protein